MVRQWCAFFELVRASVNEMKFLIGGGVIFSIWMSLPFPQQGFCGPSEGPSHVSGSTSSENLEQVHLPAFDLEEVSHPAGPIRVGDLLEFKVLTQDLPWTEIDGSQIGGVSELGWYVTTQKKGDGQSSPRIQAIPLKPGKLSLPSLILKDSTSQSVARTNSLNFDIVSAIKETDPKPNEPEGIQPPVPLQFPIWIVLFLGGVGLVIVVGLVYLLYRWRKSQKSKKAISLPKSKLSEDEVALKALEELEGQALLKQCNFKLYYFKISEILKAYLGSRYQFDALESTTREMLAFFEARSLTSDSMVNQLKELYDKLDRVKFTDYVPEVEEGVWVLDESRKFIKSSRRLAPTAFALHPTQQVEK